MDSATADIAAARQGELEYGLPYADTLFVNQPAPGQNAPVQVDGAWAVRVIYALCTVQTDANVANRFLSLDFIQTRSSVPIRNAAGLVITAGTPATVFHFQANRTVGEWAANTPVFAPLANYLIVPGFSIQFTLDNKQAGDQLSAITLFVMKYPTGEDNAPVGVVAY